MRRSGKPSEASVPRGLVPLDQPLLRAASRFAQSRQWAMIVSNLIGTKFNLVWPKSIGPGGTESSFKMFLPIGNGI